MSLEQLSTRLLKECQHANSPELNILLDQLSEAVNSPQDLTCLIGPVVKLLPNHNFNIKKRIYSVLPRICNTHPDSALLVVNSILKDSQDPNPAVKCIAVSTLCHMPTLLSDHVGPVLDAALRDTHPRVRRAAVVGCGKIHKTAPILLQELGFIDRLYMGIRDPDAVVMINCLLVLDTVLASEGGVVINRSISRYLLQRLQDLPDQQLATVFQFLAKYKPPEDHELFQILSLLDPYLIHSSSAAVVINCTNLFLHLIESNYSHLHSQVVERVVPIIKNYLNSEQTSHDNLNYILDFLISKKCDLIWMRAFGDCPNLFYSSRGEINLQKKKLSLLPYICNNENLSIIMAAIQENFCTDPRTNFDAVVCLCKIAANLPLVAGKPSLSLLMMLFERRDHKLCDHILKSLQEIDIRQFDQSEILRLYTKFTEFIDIDVCIPPIILIMLIEFGECLGDKAVYMLENLAARYETYNDECTHNLIFSATLKLFLKMPAKYQHILGEIMEKSVKICKSSELKLRVVCYYYLLKHDANLVKKILHPNL